jgi:hypothetical protein
VFGKKVYTSTTAAASSWTNVDTLLTTSDTPVGFTEFIDSTNTKKLVLVDGVEGYVYTSNAAGTKITDGDFPTPHLPYPIFLDGYLFLAKSATGDIYNSDLDNPANWTAGSFISSEMYPDDLQALVKVNNFLLAVGTQGCEYFYDAANATASPLARYAEYSLPFGTAIPTSIAANKNTVVMLANNNDGEMVFQVIEDFKTKPLPAPPVVQTINQALRSIVPLTSPYLRGFFLRQSGELLYVIQLNGKGQEFWPCFAFSFSTGMWISFNYGGSSRSFPVMFTAPSTTKNITNFVQGYNGYFGFFGKMETNATYTAMDDLDTTGGTNVNQHSYVTQITTPSLNFGTINQKTMSRFGIICGLSAYRASDYVYVSWCDTDFDTVGFVGNFRLYLTNASGAYLNYPCITQLGSFRQRAFRLNYPEPGFPAGKYIKYWYAEADINKGQQ